MTAQSWRMVGVRKGVEVHSGDGLCAGEVGRLWKDTRS